MDSCRVIEQPRGSSFTRNASQGISFMLITFVLSRFPAAVWWPMTQFEIFRGRFTDIGLTSRDQIHITMHTTCTTELWTRRVVFCFLLFLKIQLVFAQRFLFVASTRKQLVISGPVTRAKLDSVLFTCIRKTQYVYWPQSQR